jgi:glutaminyl-tRNA synthetase
MENPPPKYFRLRPGGEVRLKYAYILKCDEVVKSPSGEVLELRCTADLGSRMGGPTANRKVKGTIHWVSAEHALDAEVRLYDRLFTVPEPDAEGRDFKQFLNPNSCEVVTAKLEPSMKDTKPEVRYQFERLGYFCLDPGANGKPVFNRTITLKDTWAKEAKR